MSELTTSSFLNRQPGAGKGSAPDSIPRRYLPWRYFYRRRTETTLSLKSAGRGTAFMKVLRANNFHAQA
jgi:hypothetical protein